MMIHHIALWTSDLEIMRTFYETYFGGRSSKLYENPAKRFKSYFISFKQGARLELMHKEGINREDDPEARLGVTHFAFVLESEEAVVLLTERFRADGYPIAGEPRTTGDGYFESVILDPEGNRVELVADDS
jgi:catechol 2,3-dioxygenase-like lactoylglutathione lyase family enzyme